MLKISLITANRNCTIWLAAMIDSVRDQGFSDYEHLILDDCSTDSSRRVLRKLSERDSKLKIIHASKRMRCGSAYAKLASQAKGEIIGVLDSDDCLTSNSLQTIADLYDKYPEVGYIWTQFWWCDQYLKKQHKGNSAHPGKKTLLEAGIARKHCFSHWRTFRKSIISEVGSGYIFKEGLKSAVDKYMGYALEELAIGGFIDIPLYKYRQRLSGNLSGTGRRNWERMKRKFPIKREEQKIAAHEIKTLEI